MSDALFPDGSVASFSEGGGSVHDGPTAIDRLRLISAKSALSIYIKTDGQMQLTRNGAQLAIENVIAPMTGKKYKRSMNGKREALADAEALLAQLEGSAVVWDGQ